MARFHVTAAAARRLRELRDGYSAAPAVVVLYWTGAQADSHRRPNGGTEWVQVSEGRWQVAFDSRAKYASASLPFELVDDLEFVVKEFSQQQTDRIDGRTLDYVNGDFHVR